MRRRRDTIGRMATLLSRSTARPALQQSVHSSLFGSQRLFALASLLAVLGCGGTAEPARVPVPAEAGAPAATAGELKPSDNYLDPAQAVPEPARLDDKWWERPMPCPAGSALTGSVPPDGTDIRCRTPKGVNEGRGTTFHPHGVKKREGVFRNNFAGGVFSEWDVEGQLSRVATFVDGREHGLVTEYHPNGEISAQREYRAGVRNGPSTLWDEAGNKRLEQPYEQGKKHGVASHWTIDGRVFKVELWENDQLVKSQAADFRQRVEQP
jgi:hypothetical protein